jgi:hypothetical protein
VKEVRQEQTEQNYDEIGNMIKFNLEESEKKTA